MQPLWRTQWRFLKKRKTESPYDPAIPLLGIYLEKALIQKDTCSPMFIATLFTITKMWKQPKHLSIDQFSSIQFNRSVVSKSLRSHELQQARSPCPSPAPELAQTHVHPVGDAIQPSHSLLSPFPPAPNPSQHQSLFQ